MDSEQREELKRDMFLAMRDLLGSGYVPSYYEEMAAQFIAIAEEAAHQTARRCVEIVLDSDSKCLICGLTARRIRSEMGLEDVPNG